MKHPFIQDEPELLHDNTGKPLPVNDYLLLIQPPQDMYEKIMRQKKLFADTYEYPAALYSKPHITLLRFMQWQMNEQRIMQRLQTIIQTATPFLVTLNNFGSFPAHTIYIQVATKNAIVALVKSLRPVQSYLKFNDEHKPHFITEPHITIARKLLPWQYEKAWIEYSNSNFYGSFMVNSLLLLRKNTQAKNYTIAATFQLLNQAAKNVVQTDLFI